MYTAQTNISLENYIFALLYSLTEDFSLIKSNRLPEMVNELSWWKNPSQLLRRLRGSSSRSANIKFKRK